MCVVGRMSSMSTSKTCSFDSCRRLFKRSVSNYLALSIDHGIVLFCLDCVCCNVCYNVAIANKA